VRDCHDLSERFKQQVGCITPVNFWAAVPSPVEQLLLAHLTHLCSQGDVEHSRLMQGQLKKFERDLTYLRTKHKANHPPPTFSTRELKIPIKA